MKSKKLVSGILLTMLLTLAMGTGAMAVADYHNTFQENDSTPAVYTPTWQGKTNDPYVKPTVSSADTTYCLTTGTSANVVSSYVKRSTAGKSNFQYLVSVANGTPVRMIYYPTYDNYADYVVKGEWQP